MSTAALVLLVVAAAELAGLVVLAVLLWRARARIEWLAAQLARTPRTGPLAAAERAVRAVVGTAARVRDQGVSGFLASSLEEMTRWASEDRAGIAQVASPDGTVTIFFSDIEDSTARNEELGDDAWVRVLTAHDALVRAAVARQRGHVVKTQGDGFMVVFGAPAAGVRAAVEIQREMQRTAPRRLRRAGLRVRIGLHFGPVVSRDGDYFGRNVAMAARVAAAAQGGEILVSDALRAALDGEFELTQREEAELKGLAGVHTLWEVVSSTS